MVISSRMLNRSRGPSCFAILALLLGDLSNDPHSLRAQEFAATPGAVAEHAVTDNILRIVSGEYTAQGTWTERPYRRKAWLENARQELSATSSADVEPGSPYSLVIRCTFDFSRELFFFRRQRERMSDSPNEFLERFSEIWYVTQPNKTIHVTQGAASHRPYVVGIHPPQSPAKINRFLRPVFDVRNLPFLRLDLLEESIGDTGLVAQIVAKPDEVKAAGSLIECIKRNEAREFTWWCDAQQGYQVVRTREAELPDPKYPDRVIVPLSVSSTTWVQRGDLWVPASHHVRSRRGTVEREMDLTFEWQSVNEPADQRVFDWRDWDLPDESAVRELRVEGNNIFTIHRFGVPHEIPIPSQHATSAFSARRFLLMLNAAILAGIVGYFAYRKLQRR